MSLVRYLLLKKALVTAFDLKTAAELGVTYSFLKKQNLKLSLGSDYLKKGLLNFDFIFRSPGIMLSLPELVQARKGGIPILSVTKLFFKSCPGRIIGVTGTKGKGTTATLIFKILKQSGKQVFLVGNIGRSALEVLPKLTKDSWVVYELSSFQLQDLDQSPHVAVVLFISSDHLDYHQTREEYVEAKKTIVKFQSTKDLAVLNADNLTSASFSSKTPAKTCYFSSQQRVEGAYILDKQKIVLSLGGKEIVLGNVDQLKLLGEHNWENVTAAVAAGAVVGADLKAIKQIIFSFTGLKHRLEPVGLIGGVCYYNDSFSTTPETAIAAIKAFSKPLVLIAGGSDKKADFTAFGTEIAASSVRVLILIGQTASRIKTAACRAGFKGQIVEGIGSMKAIVKKAGELAKSGEVVLLSPACASFDMFLNYKDRGDQFANEVSWQKKFGKVEDDFSPN